VQRPNQPPRATALAPDRKSPQVAGTPVRWTASAVDADRDQILYQFWLKGPSTASAWKVVQDWSNRNQWTWTDAPADAGSYSVYVYVRDGKHAGPGGFDSALGAAYTLENPLAAKRLTAASAPGAMPSLIFTGDGFLMAYQSWEKGQDFQGDVVLQKFDPAWNRQKSVWVADSKAPESAPSLIAAGGYYYVAYVSAEKGGRDIFVKKYDQSLKLIDTKQLTSSPTSQDSPSLLAVGSDFLLACQSFDTGSDSGGDIFLTGYDQNWKPQKTVQLTDMKTYQDRPSMAYGGGSIFVAYVSRETGNLDIFMKRLDGKLDVLETKKMTSEKSDQDYPSLKWQSCQILLHYASKKTGNYEIMLDRYLRDGKPIDSTVAASGPGDQTGSSLAFSTLDAVYWVAYASKDTSGQNINARPLSLAAPSALRPCEIAASFSATRAGSPYTLTIKFTNNYGEPADPVDLSFIPSLDSARPTDKLQKVSQGTLQFKSVFGAKGDKSFKIGANIDGCISARTVVVKVA
jgi:hypothetical protein